MGSVETIAWVGGALVAVSAVVSVIVAGYSINREGLQSNDFKKIFLRAFNIRAKGEDEVESRVCRSARR